MGHAMAKPSAVNANDTRNTVSTMRPNEASVMCMPTSGAKTKKISPWAAASVVPPNTFPRTMAARGTGATSTESRKPSLRSSITMMSVIEDRNEGFLLSVLVAPVPRAAIVLGKVLGGTTLAAAQGLIFLVFAPLVGIHMTLASFGLIVLTVFLVSFALTALGFAIAWPMDSTQAFHAVINLFLIPLWLLSGALFPLSGASGWIRWLMYANPLTYGVEALRTLMYPAAPSTFSLTASILTLLLFTLFMFGLAFVMANRKK